MLQMYLNEIKINNIKDITHLKDELVLLLNSKISHLLVTFNLDFLRISTKNEEFKQVCKNARIVLADGTGITFLLKLKYGISINRLTGNDLFLLILEIANDKNLKLALVGSTKKSLDNLQSKLGTAFPNISLLAISPPFLFETNPTANFNVVEELKIFKPDILVVALGCPRQEIWLADNMQIINAKINVGVGAAFDFYSGTKRRAPKGLQKLGLEWIWRLMTEPRRLSNRYLIYDLPFFIGQVQAILKNKIIKSG